MATTKLLHNPTHAANILAGKSEFDLLLECMQAQRFGGHTITGLVDRVEQLSEPELYRTARELTLSDAHLGAVEDDMELERRLRG